MCGSQHCPVQSKHLERNYCELYAVINDDLFITFMLKIERERFEFRRRKKNDQTKPNKDFRFRENVVKLCKIPAFLWKLIVCTSFAVSNRVFTWTLWIRLDVMISDLWRQFERFTCAFSWFYMEKEKKPTLRKWHMFSFIHLLKLSIRKVSNDAEMYCFLSSNQTDH